MRRHHGQIGRHPEALDERDRAAGGSVCREPSLPEQVAREHALHPMQHERIGNDRTHWRTGTWVITWSTRCADVSDVEADEIASA